MGNNILTSGGLTKSIAIIALTFFCYGKLQAQELVNLFKITTHTNVTLTKKGVMEMECYEQNNYNKVYKEYIRRQIMPFLTINKFTDIIYEANNFLDSDIFCNHYLPYFIELIKDQEPEKMHTYMVDVLG